MSTTDHGILRAVRTPARPSTAASTYPHTASTARTKVLRHLRAALTGIALAAVLLAGLQAYAAQGVGDAPSPAPVSDR